MSELTKNYKEKKEKEEEDKRINGPIIIEAPGQEPRQLKNGEIRTILNEQVKKIKEQSKEIESLKGIIQNPKQEVENAELVMKLRDNTIVELNRDIDLLKTKLTNVDNSLISSID